MALRLARLDLIQIFCAVDDFYHEFERLCERAIPRLPCDGSLCDTASLPPTVVVPTHRRSQSYASNCLFPWQSASDGSRCGAMAAVVREGGS
ncbi:hypothetical protein [Phormidium tenue]|uniref:hypothetical protein n=1 Tax=Phormidium tenue TaxID=126344 RepID=UPI0011153772|nr:hypothetical protein [Phormidium tenue]MBD2234585.1 hypothetical protein [Phormidium tenue FACHB-1052]